MNDTHLRSAFPVPHESPALDAKIDRALDAHTQSRRVRRRVFVGAAVTAALALAFVAGPAVQAQAALSGIVRALDRQIRARATTFNVDEAGRRWPSGTATIADGDVAYVDATGTARIYEVGDKIYNLDPTIGRFVVSPRQPDGSLRLSDMLSGAAGFSLGKRARVERVGGVLRATVLNGSLSERYVIDADPRTELPIRMRVDALERGAWRVCREIHFDYDAPVAAIQPDLKRYPPTTLKEAAAMLERAMTRKELAQTPFRKGRLVVRAIDVAQDGTVFVAFQTGNRDPHSWSGFALDVKDDLGTAYASNMEIFTGLEEPFRLPDGKIEMQIFVPIHPLPPDRSRTLEIVPNRGLRGRFQPKTPVDVRYPDGRVEKRWFPNSEIEGLSVPKSLLKKRFAGATCDGYPAWAARLDRGSFHDPISVEITKAGFRAKAAMDAKDWPGAETWLNEKLRLMERHARQGENPFDRSRTLEDLDKVRRARAGEAMGGSSKP